MVERQQQNHSSELGQASQELRAGIEEGKQILGDIDSDLQTLEIQIVIARENNAPTDELIQKVIRTEERRKEVEEILREANIVDERASKLKDKIAQILEKYSSRVN
jgi:hypothetical protein